MTAWPRAVETSGVLGPPVCECAASETCAPALDQNSMPQPEPIAIAAAPEPEPAAGFDFMWVTAGHGDTGPVLVLSLEPDSAWVSGPPQLVDDGGVVVRSLNDEALPAALRARVGQRVDAITDAGEVCTAEVGAPQLVADAAGDLDILLSLDDDESGDDSQPSDTPSALDRCARLPTAMRWR